MGKKTSSLLTNLALYMVSNMTHVACCRLDAPAVQNFARKYRAPIDEVVYTFEVMDFNLPDSPPEEGCYVHGLYLEGCFLRRPSLELLWEFLFTPPLSLSLALKRERKNIT